MLKNSRGFTLVELLVVMGIFITVMLMTSYAFENILSQAGQQTKSVETETEGVVGLEILRSDLAHAGLGLPWSMNGASYQEVASTVVVGDTAPGIDPKSLDDASNPPRAVLSINRTNNGIDGADYLVVKTPMVGINETGKKWGQYTAGGVVQNNSSPQFKNNDRVIAVNQRFNNTTQSDKIYRGKAIFQQITSLKPKSPSDNITLYGVRNDSSNDLRMPFNRADYYIKRPTDAKSIPKTCAPNTGILYKAVVTNSTGGSGGEFTEYPLLDCVADMQVVYGLDTNGDGGVDLHVAGPSSPSVAPFGTAAEIRDQVKEVRVYILAQEGGKDRNFNFTYPSHRITVGEFGLGRDFDFVAANITGYNNYRWKVYTLVVRPNLY